MFEIIANAAGIASDKFMVVVFGKSHMQTNRSTLLLRGVVAIFIAILMILYLIQPIANALPDGLVGLAFVSLTTLALAFILSCATKIGNAFLGKR